MKIMTYLHNIFFKYKGVGRLGSLREYCELLSRFRGGALAANVFLA